MPKIKTERPKNRNNPMGEKQCIQFNKTLGQHILKNPLVVDTMVEKVSPSYPSQE